MNDVALLLNIARKCHQAADFRQMRSYALQAKEAATGLEWLDCQRFLITSHRELLQNAELDIIKVELQQFLKTAQVQELAKAYYLLAQLFAYRHEWPIAKSHVEKSLQYALEANNNEDVAYALFGVAMIDAYQGNFDQASVQLNKLDIMIESLDRVEIEISVKLLKTFVYRSLKNTELAIKQVWAAYELAKRAGYHVFIPLTLSNLASLHLEKGALNEAQFYLSLAEKGVVQEQQPFLFQFFEREKKRFAKLVPNSDYDLIVDVRAKTICERNKGTIDFRNQHTLLDLAVLFLKNPQRSFTKEELIEKVWGLPYDPSLHDNLIYVTIKRLRGMIEPNSDTPKYILRNRKGYYFDNSNSLLFKMEEQAV
jgi:tetratricopeptide (TPR) repeat protein